MELSTLQTIGLCSYPMSFFTVVWGSVTFHFLKEDITGAVKLIQKIAMASFYLFTVTLSYLIQEPVRLLILGKSLLSVMK